MVQDGFLYNDEILYCCLSLGDGQLSEDFFEGQQVCVGVDGDLVRVGGVRFMVGG